MRFECSDVFVSFNSTLVVFVIIRNIIQLLFNLTYHALVILQSLEILNEGLH